MVNSFQALQDFIQTGDTSFSSFEACHQRLIDAVNAEGRKRSPVDIACLVRHALRREDELQKGETFIKVPRTFPSPDRETWQQSGIKIVGEGSDYYLISARPWLPDWLNCADESPESAAFKETLRRNYDPVPGDPFLKLVGLQNYRSAAQREAIRAVLTAPKNSTLVVNLPTGSGKSLCA